MNCQHVRRVGRFPRRIGMALGACLVVAIGFTSLAQALTIPVNCNGQHVGDITVNTSGSGVAGGFTSIVGTPPSLAAAAQICEEDHFNWYQVITADNMPPNDAGGQPLVPPYPDPPPGGYGPPSTQWADNLPWYWDEGADPPPATPGFADGYNLDDNLQDISPADGTDDTLNFADYPGGAAGSSVTFKTWLVSLNADGSLHGFHSGFEWMWSNPTGGAGSSTITPGALTPQAGQALYNSLAVPEPASFAMMAFAVCAFLGWHGRRNAA